MSKEESDINVKKYGGRAEITLDMKQIDDLLTAGCTGTQVAAYFGIHKDTLYDRIVKEKGVSFSDYSAYKRQKGESLLKATQFAKAIGASKKGDNMMLIWLGKNMLDQSDSPKQFDSINDQSIDNTIKEAKEKAALREEIKRLKEMYEPETGTEYLRSEQETEYLVRSGEVWEDSQ